MDTLVTALLDLSGELPEFPTPMLIGGGFGLYHRIKDERKNLGAHHALDIYRIVSMLTREEYDLVRRLSTGYADSEAVVAASTIVRNEFKNLEGIGSLRLRQGAMEAGLQWSEVRSDDFVLVLGELFPPGRVREG